MQNLIIIKGLKIFAHHGVHKKEKVSGQNFIIDCQITTNKLKGYHNDRIQDILSYSDVTKEIVKVLTEKSYNLLERLAEILSRHLIESFSEISEINLTIKKPEAPMKAEFDYVAVQVSRKRSDYVE